MSGGDDGARMMATAINNLARAMTADNPMISHVECLQCGRMDFDVAEDAVSFCKCEDKDARA